jgi:predicted ATPase/DNA-binding CsgD family transcriptional regulator
VLTPIQALPFVRDLDIILFVPGMVHSPDDVAGRKAGNPTLEPSGDLPRLRVLGRPAHNLPTQLSSFIGREREIEQVKHLLSGSRLVTLTGAGGCGKTRLALQVAIDLVDVPSRGSSQRFKDGAWWVELASLTEASRVPQEVANTLTVREVPSQPLSETLANHLRVRRLLLILDNCEHLIMACAQLAEGLLQACPHLTILATSREPLGLAGEMVFHVPSLSTPPAQLQSPQVLQVLMQYEAVRLFVERAVAAQLSFKLTEQNAPAVAQICQRLDGIPLALELAAARVKVLKVEHIAARLDDRFNLLTTGNRTALPRHQTLRATIDWSYDLLPEDGRILFRRLSVFAGGFTMNAAERICSDEPLTPRAVLDLLARLVDRSLVMVDQQHEEERYRMLETIRQYASEKLVESGEVVTIRNRHVDFFLQLAEEAAPQMEGSEQVTWLNRLEREHDNMRAALAWSRTAKDKAELGLRLAGALARFWNLRGYFREGREHLSAALSKPEASAGTAARPKALYEAGGLAFQQSDFPAAHSLLEQSVSMYRELGPAGRLGFAEALRFLGYTATEVGDYATAFPLMIEALGIMRELKDVSGIARALRQLGWYTLRTGDSAQAAKYFEEALALFRQIGDKVEMSNAVSGLAEVMLRQGDSVRATALQEESLQLARELGDRWRVAASLGSSAWIALRQGDLKKAATLLGESLTLRRDIGDRGGIAWCLEKFAEVAIAHGQIESSPLRYEHFRRAARLFGAAAARRAPIGSVMDLVDQPEYERQLAVVRAQLDAQAEPALGLSKGSGEVRAFEMAWVEGQAMTLEQAIEYALETPSPSEELARPIHPLTLRQAAKKEFGGLTERERQVAALVAQGMSNREIANQLVISERTVESHVANILNKLGFTARTQIGVWAAEKGLVTNASRDKF